MGRDRIDEIEMKSYAFNFDLFPSKSKRQDKCDVFHSKNGLGIKLRNFKWCHKAICYFNLLLRVIIVEELTASHGLREDDQLNL